MKVIGIYKITNNITNEIYIGQSINCYKRFQIHKYNHKQPNKRNIPLYHAMNTYGFDNFIFDVIEVCEKSLLNERELFWINFYDSFNVGYNCQTGGICGYKIKEDSYKKTLDKKKNRIVSDKFKERISQLKSKRVVQLDFNGNKIKEWKSCVEAGKSLKINNGHIGAVCNKKRNTAGGFKWQFLLVILFIINIQIVKSQNSYPQIQIINGDTIVCQTIEQTRWVSTRLEELNTCKEVLGVDDSIINSHILKEKLLQDIITQKDLMIGNRDSTIADQKIIINSQDNIIKDVTKENKGLRIKNTLILIVAGIITTLSLFL